MLRTKRLTTIALYLLIFCCPLVNNGYCATPSAISLSTLAPYIPVTTTIGLVKLASATTIYASQTIGAAAKIEASSTVFSTTSGIIIAGTLDGSHESSVTFANPALPALLICATTTNTTKVLDINNLTINYTGWLTSRNTATLAITTAVKGGIYNHGSITGDTCVQIGQPSALTAFLLDGSFTNKGLISAKQPNGKAFIIAGQKTANINSFSVYNFGMLSGNLDFEADSSDFKYRLENINYIVKHGNYKVGDRDDSIIEAATLEVKNANLTVYNEHIINIDNLQVQATKKTVVNLESKNNIFATVYPQARGKQPAQINIKNSLVNSNLGVITTAGTVVINKLVNPYNGTVTFTDSHVNLQEVTNSGYMQAQDKLKISGVVTNSKKGYLTANDVLTFNNHLTNFGTITAKQTLNINAQADNSGHINALAGLNATGVFTNKLTGLVAIKTGSATFSALVTNFGTITATTGLLTFNKRVENSGIISAKAGIATYDLLVNNKGATLSISGSTKAHINSLENDGVVYCKDGELKLLHKSINRGLIATKHGFDAIDFTNQQGATLTVSGLNATFSRSFINNGYINSAVHVSTNAATNSGVVIATKGLHAEDKFINAKGGSLTVSGGDLIFTDTLINDGSITTKDHQLELRKPSVNHGYIDAKLGVETTQTFTNGTNARLIICDHIDIQGTARIASMKYFPLTIGTATISKLIATKDPIGRDLTLSGKTEIQNLINSTKITANAKLILTEMSNSGKIIAKGKLEFTKEATNAGIIEAHKGLNISSGTFTNKEKATLNVAGGNFQVDAFLANSGAISSASSTCFLQEVTNSGIIQANYGLHAHEKLTNSLGGRLIVKAKPLDIHGDTINYGTITSEKQVAFNMPVFNSGFIDAQLELGMYASVTNANQAYILANGGLLTITGIIDNSGFIEAKQGMHAKSDVNNNIGARILVSTEKLILTEVSNSGQIKADDGLTVKGSFTNYNKGELAVNGGELAIYKKVVNFGTITSAKLSCFYQDTTNYGYIETNSGLTIYKDFTNNATATTVIKGQEFDVSGKIHNHGTITSSKLISVQELNNNAYIKADNGLTIEGILPFFNSKNAILAVDGRALTVQSLLVLNLGTITSAKSVYCAKTLQNLNYIEANDGLVINNDFVNHASATTIVRGEKLTVHGVVDNYGAIISSGFVTFKEEATNSGYIQANDGLAITGSQPFYNFATATIVVTGRELTIHGSVINLGTITSAKPAHFAREAFNSGYLAANDGLTIDGAFSNTKTTIVKGDKLAVHGIVSNSGNITSTGWIVFKEHASNKGLIQADAGLTIAGSNTFTNYQNATINVDGRELAINGAVTNFGRITSAKPAHFARNVYNSGYLEADDGLTIDGAFSNTNTTIVKGDKLAVHGIVNNSGDINATGWIVFKEHASNKGLIQADDGLTIAGSNTFTNHPHAIINVNGRELAINGMVINLGDINSTKPAYFARETINNGYLQADDGLTIEASFTNTDYTIVKGNNFTVHGIVSNSGTITSTGFITFKEEATNSGYIEANAGLAIAGSNTFTNSKNAVINVAGRELAVNGMVINLGTITSTKPAHFARDVYNSGFLEADDGLTIESSFTNKTNTIINGNNFTVHGIVSNSGTITSTKPAHFARDVYNSGFLEADDGLTIESSFTNKTNTIINGNNFTVHGIVSNSGTITSTGFITFKEEATNSGYIKANAGLTIAGSNTFTNSNNAQIIVAGKELTIHGMIINRGTISSKEHVHFYRSTNNSGYLEADSGLTIDGSFTNNKTAITTIGTNELTVHGMVTNFGTITSDDLITFTKGANNSGYIAAKYGITANGTITNAKSSKITIYNDIKINGTALIKGMAVLQHGCSIGTSTISNFEVTGNKDVVFFGSSTIVKLANIGHIRADAPLIIIDSSNSGKIIADNNLNFINTTTNTGTVIANERVMQFSNNLYNIGNIKARAGLIVTGTLTNYNNSSVNIHDAVEIENTATILGISNTGSNTVVFGTATIAKLTNHSKTHIHFLAAATVTKLSNDNYLVADATISLGEVLNSGVIRAKKIITINDTSQNENYIFAKQGLIANATFTNTKLGSVLIDDGTASFNAAVDNYGIITTNNVRLTFNNNSFNTGEIIANKGLTANDNFTNKNGSVTVSGASAVFNKNVDNTGIITANDHLFFNDDLVNDGEIIAHDELDIMNVLINKSQGKIFGSELLRSSFNIIDNHGFIAVAAGSDAKKYHGYAASELQITLPVTEPKAPLFYVANTATFDSTAKIILDATTDLDYLQQGAKVTILKANTIQTADSLNELLYRYIKPKNYFISISDAIIINNGIEVTVQQDINKILNLTDKYVKFSKSLLKKNIVNINSIKIAEAMSESVKLYQADKNTVVLDQITDIITKNNIAGIDINHIKEEISIPGYEINKTAETQNKITSKVSNKLKTDKKQYKYWKNKGLNFRAKDNPDVIWLLTSYQQGKDRNTNKDNQYKKYQDKIICLGVKHDIASFDAGFSVAYMHSNKHTYEKNNKQTSKEISSATKKSFLFLLHAMRDFSDFNTLVAFSYGQANHKSSYKTTFDNRSYSALFSANYEIRINNFEIELGLTSRLIHIYTPSYNVSNNTQVILQNSNSDYFSLGPMMSVGFNHKLADKSGVSIECSTGYLHTFNINKNKQYELAFADYKFNLERRSYAKSSFYLITKLHFFHDNIFLGLDFNWNHDTEKNIYGISLFTGLRF